MTNWPAEGVIIGGVHPCDPDSWQPSNELEYLCRDAQRCYPGVELEIVQMSAPGPSKPIPCEGGYSYVTYGPSFIVRPKGSEPGAGVTEHHAMTQALAASMKPAEALWTDQDGFMIPGGVALRPDPLPPLVSRSPLAYWLRGRSMLTPPSEWTPFGVINAEIDDE